MVRPHHLDAAAPGRPGVGLDAGAHLIRAAGHGASLPRSCRVRRSGSRAEAVRHGAERGSRGAGRLDAALPMPLHRGRLASRARAGGRHACWRRDGGPLPRRCGSWGSARRPASPCYHRVLSHGHWCSRALAHRLLCCSSPPSCRTARWWSASTTPSSGAGARGSRRRDLPRPGPLQPWPLRQGQRPALAVRHAARARALGRLRLGPALPGRAGALRAVRRRAGHAKKLTDWGRRRCCRSPAGCPGGASSRWPTAASRPSPCCATSRRT